MLHRQRHQHWTIFLILLGTILASCAGLTSSPAASEGNTQIPDLDRTTAGDTSPESYARFDIGEDLYVRQVQDGVFIITHSFPWPGNSMIVEMKSSDLVLVDTPYTPEATREVLDWVKAQMGEREITAINTGFHYDNLGGNSYLIDEGIPVYGSELTATLLAQRGEDMRAMTLDWLQAPRYRRYYEAHAALVYAAPTHLFDLEEGLQLKFGDEVVQVYYPGPSHAPDNVVVYFPSRKLLFGTCMIIGEDKVGNTSDADMAAWPESVRDLSRFDFNMLVPGHGDRLDPGLLEHTLDLLTSMQN